MLGAGRVDGSLMSASDVGECSGWMSSLLSACNSCRSARSDDGMWIPECVVVVGDVVGCCDSMCCGGGGR